MRAIVDTMYMCICFCLLWCGLCEVMHQRHGRAKWERFDFMIYEQESSKTLLPCYYVFVIWRAGSAMSVWCLRISDCSKIHTPHGFSIT